MFCHSSGTLPLHPRFAIPNGRRLCEEEGCGGFDGGVEQREEGGDSGPSHLLFPLLNAKRTRYL